MHVAVVGGAGYIGSAIVADLEEHGHDPVILDLLETRADVPIDVRDERSVTAAFRGLDVDALVYVSGRQVAAPIQATSSAQWDGLFAVNVRGAFLCVRAMLAHHATEAIVLVASVAGLRYGGPGLTAYSASKGAEIALGRALAVELAPVRVNVVCPGWTDTPFNDPTVAYMGGRAAQEALVKEGVPLRRQGEPREIAPAVRFALTSRYMTGSVIAVDGGVSLH